MGWIYTMLASGGELFMVWGLKQPHKAVVFIAWAVGSVWAGYYLNLALQRLDSSSVYPIWVSIGSMGALLMGTSLYGERLNRYQLLSLSLLIIGCIGLFIGGH